MIEVKSYELWHWAPEMSVGIDAIDKYHKRLFQLFYEAHVIAENGGERALLNKLAMGLLLYGESYFTRKEAIMQSLSYPFADSEVALHQMISQELHQKFKNTVKANGDIAGFIVYLKDCFIEYLNKTNQHIKRFSKEHEREIEDALNVDGFLTLPEEIIIYVVDDEPQQVEMLKELIEVAGFSAKGFTSAVEFINQPVSSDDIVVLDLNMPEMDGRELSEFIRFNSETSHIPIIMVTSESVNSLHMANIHQTGVNALCDKPFEVEQVKMLLISLLEE